MDRNKHLKSYRNTKLIMIIFVLLMGINTCSCGFPADKQAGVKITTVPTGVAAGDVTISADVSNFVIADETGNQNISGKGHMIYYMDSPAPTYFDHSATSKAGTYAIAYAASYTWKGVTPGEHTFSVQLVNEDDTPLAAPATDSITIVVGPPPGEPDITFVTPADGDSLPPGNIVLALAVDNFIISKKDTGVVNREGEGHLIYYLDEDPPIDAGHPALTDTSTVSFATSYLWKNVKEGKHVFAVQLVNNDDTPLDSPVVKTLSIDVAP